jgi:hypothetical protein
MALINNLQDVERELNSIKNEIGVLKKADMDLKDRRIINLRPSQKPHDAVARIELLQLIDELGKRPQQSAGNAGAGIGVFGAFIGSPLEIRNNCCPPHICVQSGNLSAVYCTMKVSSATGNTIVKLYKNDDYEPGGTPDEANLVLEIEIPEGTLFTEPFVLLSEEFTGSAENRSFEIGDTITICISSVGADYAGESLLLKFIYQ